MKYYLITIETRYSTEEYLIPVLETETIEQATEKALSDIAFCEDWEIIKETKKVKLRDLTAEQVKKWIDENCNRGDYCKDCPFRCIECYDTFWLSHKDMFSDKFLNQEVEIEKE